MYPKLLLRPKLFFAIAIFFGVVAQSRADSPDPTKLPGSDSTLDSSTKTVRVLTIGNSFAQDGTHYLPEVARSAGKVQIEVTGANPGGWTLRQHADAAADPVLKPYRIGGQATDIRTLLKAQDWDYVTIQQMSALSYRSETYQPYADQLADLIHQLAPKSKLVIQQTWAYRSDSPLLKADGLTQEEMYARLNENYANLASHLDTGLIPVGAAVQAVRSAPDRIQWRPDADFDFTNPVFPNLPDATGTLVIGWRWRGKDDRHQLSLDFKHLNDSGRLLAALVWYQSLTGLDAGETSFRPETVSESDAALFRRVASETVSKFGPVSACQTDVK